MGPGTAVAHRFNGTLTEVRTAEESDALEMLCGEFYFGPHVNWLFAEESALIHLHTDEREDCPELDILLNVLVRESGGTSRRQRYRTQSWRYAAGTAVTYLLGAQEPPGGLLRLMSDARLMPAVLAVLAAPEQPWTIESMAARAFYRAPPSPAILPASII